MKLAYKNVLQIFSIIMLFFFMTEMSAFAVDPPNPPNNLQGNVTNGQNVSYVVLTWAIKNDGTPPMIFMIYKADKETQTLSDFSRLDYVKADPSVTQYKYPVSLQPGTYSFYVTAGAIDQNTIVESQPSNIITVNVEKPNTNPVINIVSQPPTSAVVGQDWTYFMKFQTNFNCPVDMITLSGDVPPGMTIDQQSGSIHWTPDKVGQYAIVITAGTTCKINVQPAVQKFVLNVTDGQYNSPYVKITSKPPLTGKVGEEYDYQVTTESNMKCPVQFMFKSNIQDGVTFDNTTGLLKILTKTPNTYICYVIATIQCNGISVTCTQQFTVQFGDVNPPPQPCATVYGNVTYDDGTPVNDAKINFWSADAQSNTTKTIMISVPVTYGKYTVDLPQGVYISDINGPVVHEYYKDAQTVDKATRITVNCGDKTEIDYSVAKLPQPVYHTVSGTVTSETDGTPLVTTVEFIPVELMNNAKNTTPINVQFITKTDKDGNYSIKLPNNFTYIAHAFPPPNSTYMEQFYNGVDSPYEADILELTGDLTGINFALKNKVQTNNGFSGIVVDSANEPIAARVFAYLVAPQNSNNTNTRYLQQFQTDATGQFKFTNLIPGNYVLLSIPNDKKWVPGYFKDGDYAVLKWKEATIISVGDANITVIYKIMHRLRAGLKGVIIVNGKVTQSSGNIKSGSHIQSGDAALPGAFVFVLDQNGNVSDYSFSDNLGSFTMSEVAPGNNKLVVDMVGFTSFEEDLNNDYSKNFSSSLNVNLEQEALLVNDNSFTTGDYKVYPVPATNSTTIEFKAKAGLGAITIYNSIGFQINSTKVELIDGLNQFQLDLSNMQTGSYFIRVITNTGWAVLPMNIIR